MDFALAVCPAAENSISYWNTKCCVKYVQHVHCNYPLAISHRAYQILKLLTHYDDNASLFYPGKYIFVSKSLFYRRLTKPPRSHAKSYLFHKNKNITCLFVDFGVGTMHPTILHKSVNPAITAWHPFTILVFLLIV